MAGFRNIYGVVHINFLRWKNSVRLITVVVLFMSVLAVYFGRIPFFCIENEFTCSPFLMPILFSAGVNSNGSFKVLFFFISILAFSRAPFLDEHAYFVIVRSGKKNWATGGVMYLGIVSLLLTVAVVSVGCAAACPRLENDLSSYGTLPLNALSDIEFRYEEGAMKGWNLSSKIILLTDPVKSEIIVSILVFFCLFILSLLTYLGNIVFPRKFTGIAIAAFFVLLDPVLMALAKDKLKWLYIFSPASYCSLNLFRQIDGAGILSVDTAITASVMWIILLLIMIYVRLNKMDITHFDAEK